LARRRFGATFAAGQRWQTIQERMIIVTNQAISFSYSTLMIFLPRQEPFICEHCRTSVVPLKHGTYRNHCPTCLWSKHVDSEGPGDRSSTCGGMMAPVSLDFRSKKGWILIHECEKCGKRVPNKAAPDDDLTCFSKEER